MSSIALQIKRLVSNIDIPKSRVQCHANIPKSKVQYHGNIPKSTVQCHANIPNSRVQCNANIPKSRVQCHANVTSPDSWWRHQMETFSALLAFVREIHRSPVNSSHKGLWRGALVFSLICAWTKRSVAKVPNYPKVLWLVNVCSFQFLGGRTGTILFAQGSTARAETSLFKYEIS